jgi:hypothetical protein
MYDELRVCGKGMLCGCGDRCSGHIVQLQCVRCALLLVWQDDGARSL